MKTCSELNTCSKQMAENVSCNISFLHQRWNKIEQKQHTIPFSTMLWHSSSAGSQRLAENEQKSPDFCLFFSLSVSTDLPPTHTKVCCMAVKTHTRTLTIGHILRTEHLMAVCRGTVHPTSWDLTICWDQLLLLYPPHLHARETNTQEMT